MLITARTSQDLKFAVDLFVENKNEVHQPKTYSKVNEMFVELVGIFSSIND